MTDPLLYAVLINPRSSKSKRYAATTGEPGATTPDVRHARKFSTMPDAVLFVETYRERFPRAEPMVVPVDPGAMEGGSR